MSWQIFTIDIVCSGLLALAGLLLWTIEFTIDRKHEKKAKKL